MKKGLIELRTGQKYTQDFTKEEYADETVNEGFDVDYESFEEAIQKWEAQEKREGYLSN